MKAKFDNVKFWESEIIICLAIPLVYISNIFTYTMYTKSFLFELNLALPFLCSIHFASFKWLYCVLFITVDVESSESDDSSDDDEDSEDDGVPYEGLYKRKPQGQDIVVESWISAKCSLSR